MELTKSELDVLEILLNASKPLSKSDILEHSSADKCWKDSSIHILLNSLLKKEAIQEVGFVRTGKGYGRTFAPTDKGTSYFSNLLIDLTKKTKACKIFSQLIHADVFSQEELQELEDLIKERI